MNRWSIYHTRLNNTLTAMGAVLLPVCFLVGCGSSGDEQLAKVTGEVRFLGQPAQAELTFEPVTTSETGRPSTAMTNDEGQFKLQYTFDEDGATVGEHQVTIKILHQTLTGDPETFKQATEPVKVISLKRTVEPGKNEFRFHITP